MHIPPGYGSSSKSHGSGKSRGGHKPRGPKARAPKAPKAPSVVQQLRYTPEVAQQLAQMTPRQRHVLHQIARRRGLTLNGVLQPVPGPLKERSPHSLAIEARRTTNRLYAPADRALNMARRGAVALSQKRASDQRSFNTWLATQQASLRSSARAADSLLGDNLSRIQQDTRDAWGAQQQQAMDNAQSSPGNVSNPGQSNAMKMLAEVAAQQNLRGASQAQLAESQSNNALAGLDVAQSAALAATKNDDAIRQSDLNKSLTDISQKRLDLAGQKAQTRAGIKSDLVNTEISKANANRDYAAAAQKLGVDVAKMRLDARKARRDYKLRLKTLNVQAWTAKNSALAAKARIQLGYDQIAERKGKAAADQAMKAWIVKYQEAGRNQRAEIAARARQAAGGAGGATATERAASRKTFQSVQTIVGQIRQLYKENGGKGSAQRGPNKGKDYRTILRQRGYDDSTINLAFDLYRNNGRVSAGGVRTARNLGILNPQQLWRPAAGRRPRPRSTGGRPDTAGNPRVGR